MTSSRRTGTAGGEVCLMSELPKRKHTRLKDYDYSQSGAYFITVCTENRRNVLGTILVGRDDLIPPSLLLSPVGQIVEQYIRSIERAYPGVRMAGFIVMPNHIHVLLVLERGGMGSCRPTAVNSPSIMMIVRGLKRQTTMALKRSIWQSSFYEHIIRDETSYRECLQYMENNPARWAEDDYYCQSL